MQLESMLVGERKAWRKIDGWMDGVKKKPDQQRTQRRRYR